METIPPSTIITPRLEIRCAASSDAGFLLSLWTCPEVMRNVGFPSGLRITLEEVRRRIEAATPGLLGTHLIAARGESGDSVGECFMAVPDPDGRSRTDIKLLPQHWGHGYGVELKRALVDYLFEWTDCQLVVATPSEGNAASIAMQEAVGGERVGSGVWEFPEHMRAYTRPVAWIEYHLTRARWCHFRSQAGEACA